ncbi:MAG: metal ABC transporter permease [Patescibacteria group bacterium]|nr:metal ABC transporter permease [Patescibacteria group bacterium]MDE2014956.1 metal ABC transporter permease [Patescibacteria group bacterium]MDE2226385.1 metal ABC transporter permease [Patescibacteria group bacterium]
MLSPIYSIILAVLAAAAAGLVGSFALMKKTVLAGDVMSHVAIPGLGLALIWNINPLIGGAATLLLGAIIIWRLEEKTSLSSEAAIGVIFASSVALGALLINSKEELIDALFGGFGGLSTNEFIFGVAASLFVIIVLWILRNKLIINLFSSDLAASANINTSGLNLWFIILFALTILSGLRFLGALLAGALIIVPAAAARQLTHSLGWFIGMSTLLSVVSVILGFIISNTYGLELGPTVVVVAAGIFVLSLLKKKE